MEKLPPSWQEFINKPLISDFHLKFVTSTMNKKEATNCAAATGVPVNMNEFLHLYHLHGQIQTIQLTGTYNKNTEEIQCWTSSPNSLSKTA